VKAEEKNATLYTEIDELKVSLLVSLLKR